MSFTRRHFVAAASTAALLPRTALGQRAPVRNSIALDEGRVWVAAMIAGKGPYLFIIDTGATFSLIDDDIAKSLLLKQSRGRTPLIGIGGISEYPNYTADEVRFASGVRFERMAFTGTKVRLGRDAVGTFGAGLFTTHDSDLDFVKGEWRAYPGGRGDVSGLTRLASRFVGDPVHGDRIYADATIGGFAGEFLLDTGAPGIANLEGRAAAKSGLWRDDRPYAPTRARGIGRGNVPMRIVRADRLTMGPLTLDRPLVAVREPGTPTGRGDGIIGLSSLEQLHLSTDVRRRSLLVALNGRTATVPRYPLSGLWIENAGDRLSVAEVSPGSPGAAAGLNVGDQIGGIAFQPLIGQLQGPPGSEVAFTATRAGKARNVTLKLVPYL